MDLKQLEEMGFTFEYGSEGAFYDEHSNGWDVELEYVEISKGGKTETAQWDFSPTPMIELYHGTFDELGEDVLEGLRKVCEEIMNENRKSLINAAVIERIEDREDYEEIRERAKKLGEYFKDKDEDWLLIFSKAASNCHTDFIITLQTHYGQTSETATAIYNILHS